MNYRAFDSEWPRLAGFRATLHVAARVVGSRRCRLVSSVIVAAAPSVIAFLSPAAAAASAAAAAAAAAAAEADDVTRRKCARLQ